MIATLRRLCRSIAFRVKMARFGIWYTTSRRLSLASIRVAGKRLALSFPGSERAVHEFELGKILFDDCYKLNDVPRSSRTILDIGANVGLFALAARHRFRTAVIHSYEPNPSLQAHLELHCKPMGVQYFIEAVGKESDRVELRQQENSLHSVSLSSVQGSISQIAFREAVERLGGTIDLLKLDCEGAEWLMFQDSAPWQHVRHLTMEYHLWASPGATIETLVQTLSGLGFDSFRIAPSPSGPFGLLQASRQ
jgi:FkbM family methyltransferase